MLFSKLKHWLRKAAERTQDAVCDAIASILDHRHLQPNAPTTSPKQDMLEPKLIPL